MQVSIPHKGDFDPKQALAYWINEREEVRRAKERGDEKPWSQDWVFQQTYFCNVRREDDRVTRWIRGNWSPDKIGWDDYEYAMVVARFLNWPETLAKFTPSMAKGPDLRPESIQHVIERESIYGKVWGNAYVVTTHGIPMGKAAYLCQRVLPAVYDRVGAARWRRAYAGSPPSLALRHEDYMQLEGLGSFMAAQVIADLKNTPNHPLYEAEDWWTWSAPGPGSLRGLGWFFGRKIRESEYSVRMEEVRDYLVMQHSSVAEILTDGGGVNMQDLQNCLCEYDKYMRVRTGAGRSKRGYPGK